MKKLLVALFALGTLTANAQTFKDTFDSNSMGWTEISGKDGEAVIKEGVMHLEGKKSGGHHRPPDGLSSDGRLHH
jgi:hypothetical protein